MIEVTGLDELKNLASRLTEYSKNFKNVPNESLIEILEEGKETMVSLVDSDRVAASIKTENHGDGKGSIYTDHVIAPYLEYGTGIIGGLYPHPKLPGGWQYDSNEHGWSGWIYPKDGGGYGRTAGQPGQRFALDTAFMLRRKASVTVRNVLEGYKL